MATKKKRIKIAFSEETIQKLQWIFKEDQKKNKKRIYLKHLEKVNKKELVFMIMDG